MSSPATVVEKKETSRLLVLGPDAYPNLPPDAAIRLAKAVEQLPTEDNQPVDNILSAHLMHLLTEILNLSWKPLTATGLPRSFLVLANVGLYYTVKGAHVVPDVMLSMDVEPPSGFRTKSDLTYFTWDHGKVPEVAIEIVSPTSGSEDTEKLHRYEYIGVEYYAVFDPLQVLSENVLRTYQLRDGVYQLRPDNFFPKVGLGLTVWAGTYGKIQYDRWLRWQDADGVLIPMAAETITLESERADQEAERAEREAERAERESERAEREAERAAALAAKLLELGIDPDQVFKSAK
ncbi:MAG TPA: Uma2 family endonuclease [Blastocatellia bacterium]|nr:Uma2 family endonuclease [Blastocatellia bacterium]HMV86710.1 Uma2 family endonuclease [Blastocatellia bacterium]HMX29976.1 Uma2 family endonuclease [Blastocatellia bacterium]HMY71442.1 Uma2 family endonuclease [Blastocatellia bacterium]HMZ17702.1 Uma2 family endonuclease [Blastocatellia bacterium]